jgi:hypothetical protein
MNNAIIKTILKKRVIKSIDMLGLGIKELVYDIKLSEITINTIEYDKVNNLVLLHVFNDNLDMIYDFDSLSDNDKLKIISILDRI